MLQGRGKGCCTLSVWHGMCQVVPPQVPACTAQSSSGTEQRASRLCTPRSQLFQSNQLLQSWGQSCHAIGAKLVVSQVQAEEPCQLLQGRGQGCHAIGAKLVVLQVKAGKPCQLLYGRGQRGCALSLQIGLPQVSAGTAGTAGPGALSMVLRTCSCSA